MTLQTTISTALAPERVHLAAAYRLIAEFGMDDSIFTHISAKAPAAEGDEAFLINPYGLRFDEVTASTLATVNLSGEILHDALGNGINKAGFIIHSAVHAARPDLACVLHTHTVAGVAVASMKDGLLPLNQWSAPFFNRLAYHDYEGIALNQEERARIVADLGDKRAMILRNHGLLTCGRTVGEAFRTMMDLERACRAQVAILSMRTEMNLLSDELAEFTAQQEEGWADGHESAGKPDVEWEAYLRHCKARHPDFDQ